MARWRAVVALAAIAVLTLGLPLWGGIILRNRILAEAERAIATQADIVAAATERRLQSLRFALNNLPSWIDGPVLSSRAVDDDIHQAMWRLTEAGGTGIGFVAVAPDGRFVASEIGVVTPGVPTNLRGMPNLATLGRETPSGLAISAPFLALGDHILGRPTLAISRTLPSGGAIQAIVPLDVGTTLLPPTDLGEGSSVWLIRDDAQAIARWPGPVPIPGPRFDDTPLFLHALGRASSGVTNGDCLLGGSGAISAYRSLPDFGLIVIVRRDREAILAPWFDGATTTLAGLAVALLAVAALAWRASRAAAALTQSEDRAALVADALELLLWSRPSRFAVSTYHGSSAERLTGYPTEVLTARPGVWREVVMHPEDRPRVVRELAAADLSTKLQQTYRIVRVDGEVRWVSQRVKGAPGGGIIGVTYDITAQKETQERLARSEAELAEAVRIAGLGRWQLDPATNRFTFSDRIISQLGLDEAHMDPTYENFMTFVVPEDRSLVEEAFARARDRGEVVEFEYRFITPSGAMRYRWARAGRETGHDGSPGAIVGVCQDITERREAAEQLANASRLAALGQLTGGIAHDVNNMLTVVSLNLDLLADDVAPGTHASEALEAARRAAAGGSELTTQLLAFARRQPLRPSAVDVAALFGELRPMLARSLGRGVTSVLTASPGIAPVLADVAQLRSALLNLALNARDAMPAGGTIAITAAADDDPHFVAFSVTDDGAGMSPDVVARAFEPFFTTKSAGKGTGLGLSQVYGFVTQSRGTIGIESEPGAGTVVRFTLPATTVSRAAPDGCDATSLLEARVLVVEDEAELRTAVVAMCRSAGLEIAEADSAAAALGHLERGFGPDLLFSDINLGPGPDGVALAALARRLMPGLRVLFATGYTAEVEIPEGAALIRKPYTRETLLAALARALASESVGA